ncbi:pyridoxal phosphate-dependent aminotransferase family protein [Flavobacterium sp. JAS]|uniref:aminotransferase class I/II-fold pyridoxal phosphate-dependent enzyme n=1 Tax=Flavobacterium sp. JAS TaxID=2897329 RepID=UPI001E621EFD|nr:pyridoxal phosphate-dependent aminotransferase family protein [Flavobacterium sp. JAS]MCD0470031.1 pyridoxal phosphate-dependent aminotransferase family protein [Flavobacterium sp. JAS]
MKLPENLIQKLENRKQNNSLRQLPSFNNLVDFSSNDYIGFSKSESVFKQAHHYLIENDIIQNGATGSRLISGNHSLYQIAEDFIAQFHDAESALIFNSGYDANVGFFSALPQRNDVILYDELSHASIRDGIVMSNAKSYKFNHNDFEDLERLIIKFPDTNIYIVTETVFSMDGDSPNLEELVAVSEKYNCYLVVDEAHTLGVFGEKGEGLTQYLQLHNRIFARIMTFGKGLGCHGAAVLGSLELKQYLVNFARSFIYTTGLSPHSVSTILTAYHQLETESEMIEKLRQNIVLFNQQKNLLGLKPMFVRSKSAIQSAIIPGNENVKRLAQQLQDKGFDVKAILSPTVPEGQERLRFCIHSYNSEQEINQILELLRDFVF